MVVSPLASAKAAVTVYESWSLAVAWSSTVRPSGSASARAA